MKKLFCAVLIFFTFCTIFAQSSTSNSIPANADFWSEYPSEQLADFLISKMSDEELLDSYRHCGCFCMPSRVEYRPESKDYRGDGFGLVYAEAQACGRPAVGSTEGGAVDPIEEGVTGYKVDPRSPEAVADAVAKLLGNPDKADAMGRAGREFVIKHFSPEAYRRRIRAVLAEDGIVVSDGK